MKTEPRRPHLLLRSRRWPRSPGIAPRGHFPHLRRQRSRIADSGVLTSDTNATDFPSIGRDQAPGRIVLVVFVQRKQLRMNAMVGKQFLRLAYLQQQRCADSARRARSVISRKFPIGVATTYNVGSVSLVSLPCNALFAVGSGVTILGAHRLIHPPGRRAGNRDRRRPAHTGAHRGNTAATVHLFRQARRLGASRHSGRRRPDAGKRTGSNRVCHHGGHRPDSHRIPARSDARRARGDRAAYTQWRHRARSERCGKRAHARTQCSGATY